MMTLTALVNDNVTSGVTPLVSMQLSYSTADIQQSIFFGAKHQVYGQALGGSLGVATLLVVNGDMFVLDEQTTPGQWPPLAPNAGLIQLVAQAPEAE